MKNELWKRFFTVASPCSFANEDNLHKKAVSSFVLCVAVAWSYTRIEGNLLASGGEVLGEVSGPIGGRLGVLQCTKLSTSLTLE